MTESRFGTFEMSLSGPFEAGTYTTIVFTYTVGEAGLKDGGRLRIGTPNMGWGEPLVLCPNPIEETIKGPDRRHNPWKPLNTTFQLETRTNAWIEMWVEERGAYSLKSVADKAGWEWAKTATQWRWWINSDIELDDFEPGDKIIITYGDTKEHPFGIRVQPFPEEKALPFICVVDVEGDGELREVPGSPVYIGVVSGPPERIMAAAPSILRPGEFFKVRASVMDRNLTHPNKRYDGPMRFSSQSEILEIPDKPPAQEGDARTIDGVVAAKPGVGVIQITTEVDEIETNPILVVPEAEENLYWGDIHAQCMYHQWRPLEGRGASTRTPAQLHQYAKECSLLDFVANSNGGCPNPANPGWEETQQAVVDFYEPGRYVTLKSWEFGMGVQGDRCLIYREAEVEPNFPLPRRSDRDPTTAHACLRFCRESQYNIMAINHSFMKYLDWSVFDGDIDRVIEIYSCWGSYESREDNPLNSKRRPLNQSAMYCFSLGYTPGVIAAGDSHIGYPGRSLMFSDPNWCQNWKAGLAAVYTQELTREAIWDALYNRYCYGTTGARIVLRFHLNDAHMGSILEYQPDDDRLCRRNIKFTVCGTDYIRRVDVMKNNKLFHSVCPKSDRTEFAATDELDQTPTTRDWYYIRVFQADNNAAWSSPIWVGPAGVDVASVSLGE
ncbi:DUF3604 domain-containing protein [Candidatus Poribacteria bacterium]